MLTSTEFGFTMVTLLLGAILWALWELVHELRLNRQKLAAIESHQLNPRTRITQARMDNGPDTPPKVARRTGQVSRGKRVVVGGDPESELHQTLTRRAQSEGDNDD